MDLESLQPHLFEEFNHILRSDRMSHAYLFSGDFASLDFALYLAKSRFCEHFQDGLPCGKCRECVLIAENEFSDVKQIKPTGQVIKTDTIRDLLRDFSRSGFESQSQVFIIQDCDKMHPNAANSLLKFIEEPQSSSYMILLTSDESKVLPTIKSRTQVIRFPKNEALLRKQAEEAGVLKTQAEILVALAKTPQHLEKLIQDKKVEELLQASERFVATLFKDMDRAYLEVNELVKLAPEKSEQELAFQLLTLYLSKHLERKQTLVYLEKAYQAQQMWKSNVSFQNVLEYMVVS